MTKTWGAVALGVCLWCLIVMAMGVNNAHTAWEWIWTFLFGAIVPVVLLRLLAHVLPAHQRADPGPAYELQLLEALCDGGELTAAGAALRTSLALDEVATQLDSMAVRGHLDVRLADGVEHYALAGRPREAAADP